MINEEKVKAMTKLAAYDKYDSAKYTPMTEYFRSDYIGKEMLKSFVYGTIAYIFLAACWILNNADEFLANINRLDYMALGLNLLQRYILFLIMYLLITYIVYAIRYSHGRSKIKNYKKNIHAILKLYRDED